MKAITMKAMTFRSSYALILLPTLLLPVTAAAAQAAIPASATASSFVSPSLDQLRQALSSVRLDKWKAPGPVRQEASSNMGSITRDLDGTLPGLLATADAAPGVISKNLPVFRNLDALYDVLLRVVETADLSAPENDTQTLSSALLSLENSRRALGDAMEEAAVTQEAQLAAREAHAQASAPAASAASTVVDDGARGGTATHKRKPAVKKGQATTPASSTTAPQQ